MKRISFFLTLTLLILSFGLSNAQVHEISLDQTVGYFNEGGVDKIASGGTVEFHMRVTNNGSPGCYYAPSGAFVVKSDDGAEWGGITVLTPTIYYKELVTGIVYLDVPISCLFSSWFTQENSVDGVLGDTTGFAGVAFDTDVGIWEGADTVAFILQIQPTVASNGKTICLDNAGQEIGGYEWAWSVLTRPGETCAGQNEIPGWAGPYCFEVGTPPDLPPVLDNNPTTLEGSHCEVLTFDFVWHDPDPGEGPGPDDMTPAVNSGAFTSFDHTGGIWAYTGDIAYVGITLSL